jgi:hypothetical protein
MIEAANKMAKMMIGIFCFVNILIPPFPMMGCPHFLRDDDEEHHPFFNTSLMRF